MNAPAAIREARLKAGLSQTQLAIRLGVTKAAVSGWELGNKLPRTPMLMSLVNALSPHLTADGFFKLLSNDSGSQPTAPSQEQPSEPLSCPNCHPNALRIAREKAGLTQTELGNRVKVDRSLISQYEIGMKVPRMKMATALVNALKPHLTLADLLSPQPKSIASGLAPSPRIFQAAFTRLMARAGIDWTTDSDPDTAMVRAACLRSDSESGSLS